MTSLNANTDLDKSGDSFQQMRVYRGPTLGWQMVRVQPSQSITAAGSTTLSAGAGIVLVNVAGLVTVVLPSVSDWLKESFQRPVNAFEGALWIKDLGNHAASFNITVTPNGTDTIDLQSSYTIVQDGELLRLYPLNDLSGWFVG